MKGVKEKCISMRPIKKRCMETVWYSKRRVGLNGINKTISWTRVSKWVSRMWLTAGTLDPDPWTPVFLLTQSQGLQFPKSPMVPFGCTFLHPSRHFFAGPLVSSLTETTHSFPKEKRNYGEDSRRPTEWNRRVETGRVRRVRGNP